MRKSMKRHLKDDFLGVVSGIGSSYIEIALVWVCLGVSVCVCVFMCIETLFVFQVENHSVASATNIQALEGPTKKQKHIYA